MNKKVFSFAVIRARPDGIPLFDTNMRVSLEEYQIVEDAQEYGFDVGVDIKLKQWREYGTKEIELYEETQHNGNVVTMGVIINHRVSDRTVQKTYTVQKGDALYTIARTVYGDAERYIDIYNANKELIDAANAGTGLTRDVIHTGQVLTLP